MVSEQQAEQAIKQLRKIIEAAENANQAGEDAAVRAAAAPDMAEALEAAEVLLTDERDSLVDGYTILAEHHPEVGQLSAEGKELVAPFDHALGLIRAALARARGDAP